MAQTKNTDGQPSPIPPPTLSSAWTRLRIAETRINGIVDLAWFQTDVRQGDPIGALPVYVTVSCGRPNLDIADTTFTLATWQVLVRLELENARLRSAPPIKIQAGHFQSQTSTASELATIGEHALTLGLEAKANTSSIPGGSILGKFFFNRKKKSTQKESEKAKRKTEIVLIGQFGEAIAIGDPDYGDPYKEHGLLSHDYPKEPYDKMAPLFFLEPIDPSQSMRITVMTTVPFEKLFLGATNASSHIEQMALTEIKQRGGDAVEAHELLRKQMLRREFEERVSKRQKRSGLPVRDGEFAVMIELFEIRPGASGAAHGA